MYGTVTKYFYKKNYGFIRGMDGNVYFIHRSNLNGEHIEPGYYISFKAFQTDRSDYNAKDVIVIDSEVPGKRKRRGKHGKSNKEYV